MLDLLRKFPVNGNESFDYCVIISNVLITEMKLVKSVPVVLKIGNAHFPYMYFNETESLDKKQRH